MLHTPGPSRRYPLFLREALALNGRDTTAISPLSPLFLPKTVPPWREISCEELRHRCAAPQRSRRVPEDPQQKVDRHKTGILGSSHGKGFALPSLPSDRRSVSRAFWATGALSKTPVFRNHLDILIYFFDSGDRLSANR